MLASYLNDALAPIAHKDRKRALAFFCGYIHNLPNMPTKPRLFSNNMLKLSGLFFAYFLSINTPYLSKPSVLLLLAHLMRQVSPDSQWHHKVTTFISEHPEIPLFAMGFSENWMTHTLWRDADVE